MNMINKSIIVGILLPVLQAAWVSAQDAQKSQNLTAGGKPDAGISFPESLRRADVEAASMKDGQRESLLLGNGDLYGIVWEKSNGLFMRITKNDIWDARVDTSKDGELPRVDPVTHKITGPSGAPPSYDLPYPQPRCAVALRLGPVPEKMSGRLNLEKAVATIRSGEQTHASLRVLHQQNVLLIRSPQPVVMEEIKSPTLPAAKLGETDGVSWLRMNLPGDIDYKGMEYAVAVATRGELKAVSLVTSFDPGSGDVLERAITLARKTLMEKEDELVAKHEQAWRDHWSRCGVELADKTMERWWYRMLYYAGTVCRPGAAPVPILPPLAADNTPWHADFHHNYNTWQAYWPLPAANHPELADPWISYNLGMIPRYKNLAKVTYGLDGLHVPISSFLHEPDPAICKSKNQRQMSMNPWGLTIGLQAMTLQSAWQKYLCDQDVAYMKTKIYPFLREVATFYVALMEKCQRDEQGKVRLGPSYSPEHGSPGIFNCPFDIAYVHYTFDAMNEAAATLNVDGELAAKCREFKMLLPDYPTTRRNGEEIVVDWVGGDPIPEHNITVPAAPVFPADQVTWFSDEAQKKLFKQTIQQTRFRDANAHVMFNIARARLSMPEGYTEGRRWFSSRELPNGLFVWAGHGHGTFMGEMIGIAGLINEYLLQSVDNKIRLFPCWPTDQDAAFSRMRAQGGFIVSASFKNGGVESATIESVANKQLVLLSPWKKMQINGRPVEINKDGLLVIDTKPGDRLALSEE
jgi:hypothetical protein